MKTQDQRSLATQLGLDGIAALIAAHPKAMAVDAQGKQIQTWGAMKAPR